MKPTPLIPLLLCLLVPCRALAQPAAATVDELAWLGGCWSYERDGRSISEQWMHPAGGTLMGMSRTVSKGKTVAYEFMQIRQDDGGIAFVARPSGQQETAFALVAHGAGRVTFENADHDFPQRVLYRAQGADSLYGRIEGTIGGKARAVDFPMRRVPCP